MVYYKLVSLQQAMADIMIKVQKHQFRYCVHILTEHHVNLRTASIHEHPCFTVYISLLACNRHELTQG